MRELISWPLFLDPDHYISIPLETTYQTTWEGAPQYWRNVHERVPAQ